MRIPAWLDRLWLWAIGISAVIAIPTLILVWAERYGWTTVGLGLLALFLIGVYRGLSTER